jgi:hypothetical protein
MLTIFSTCRSFEIEEFAIIQRNAIQSWLLLEPKPEIFLMGVEPGVKEFCKEFNITHIDDIKYSEFGTPLLNSMMELAEERAKHEILLLVSSDVVLPSSTMEGVKAISSKFKEFCGVARKQQQEHISLLDFSGEWEEVLRKDLKWNLITSGDFFLYPKGYWGKIPDFVIGRAFCDSWLFFEASKKGNMVDMTNAIEIIDYKHSYNNLPVGWQKERLQNFILWEGKDADLTASNWVVEKNLSFRQLHHVEQLNDQPI